VTEVLTVPPARPARVGRLYVRARGVRHRLIGGLNAGFDGFWLGALDGAALDAIDQSYYDDAAEYVDDDYNLRGFERWEADAVARYFPEGGRIAVTSAGGGREVLALIDRGFDAIGYEPNAKLCHAGADLLERRGAGPGRLRPVERDEFPSGTGPLDGVIVGWGGYMLIPGRARRIRFLRDARASLEPGAPLLVSFFDRDLGEGYFAVVAKVANNVRRARRREPVEVGDTLRPNYAHHFTRQEIADELRAGGFEMAYHERRPYPHAVARAV